MLKREKNVTDYSKKTYGRFESNISYMIAQQFELLVTLVVLFP